MVYIQYLALIGINILISVVSDEQHTRLYYLITFQKFCHGCNNFAKPKGYSNLYML